MSNKIRELPTTERPRERLKEVGAENLSNKELLAIIIKNGTKEKSSLDLAIDILKEYSLNDLKNISLNKLEKIKGIGEVKALELISCLELGKRVYLQERKSLKKYSNPKDIWNASKYLFTDLKQEYFYCLYLNNKQELIERKLLFIGTINQSITHPREIFKNAYLLSASNIICLHNHPSNDSTPSKADKILTEKLIQAGEIQGIPIIDHIIICEDNYYSFYEHKNILNL